MGKKRILIVDDDKEFLQELEEVLQLSGYEMIAVSDPARVMEVATEAQVDAVVLDLKMPGKSGFELAFELSLSPKLQHVPIIAMTGVYKQGCEPLLSSCRIKRCIKKPFQPLEIISEIEAVLP